MGGGNYLYINQLLVWYRFRYVYFGMKRDLLSAMAAVLLGATPALAADGDITVTVDYSNGSVADLTQYGRRLPA